MESTAIAVPIDAALTEAPAPARLAISARFLLGIYLIVPLCLAPMFFDKLFWGGTLFDGIQRSPENYFIFQLAFGTPHIIASSILLFANADYLRTYWLRLLLFSLFLAVFFGTGAWLITYNFAVYYVLLAIVGAATVLHVIKQQVGIGKGICRLSSWVYEAWGWTLILFGAILYYAVYAAHTISQDAAFWLNSVIAGLAAVICVLTLICHTRIRTRMGQAYLWANAIMVLQSGLFYTQGYAFLAILGPRLVHDVTAFAFYVAHDVNRHGRDSHNPLYWLPRKLGLGVFWICPLLAVALTYLIDRYSDPIAQAVVTPVVGTGIPYGAAFVVAGYLGMLHYFTEAFTWRHGSPYRQHIALTS